MASNHPALFGREKKANSNHYSNCPNIHHPPTILAIVVHPHSILVQGINSNICGVLMFLLCFFASINTSCFCFLPCQPLL